MTSRHLSAFVAIGAYTVVPLVGVLAFGWDWREIMIFYWLGNISVGLSVLINMIKSPPAAWEKVIVPKEAAASAIPLTESQTAMAIKMYKIFSVFFFCMHYGLFTVVHGVFVFAIVSGAFSGDITHMPPLDLQAIFVVWLIGTIASLVTEIIAPVSQAPSIGKLWGSAYGRIIALHISIIGGAFLIQAFHLPAIVAVVLIVINFVIQLVQIKFTTLPATEAPGTV